MPPDPQALLAGVAIAIVAAVLLAPVFGLTARTIVVAVGLTIAVGTLYPGGTTGLVVDVLRPFGTLVRDEKDRGAARDAALGDAAEGRAPTTH